MIMAYGHDDRSCAFASFEALSGAPGIPERTLCAILTDKEEIGSVGATGMQARTLENAVAELVHLQGADPWRRGARWRAAACSLRCHAAYDPKFPEAYEKKTRRFWAAA
jgi:aspartyl aminopeptidase